MRTKLCARRRACARDTSLRRAHACAVLSIIALLVNATGAQQMQPDVATLDISALIREVAQNERAMQPRRLEYTWTTKVTEREVNKRGEITKETVSVYEVYPVKGEFVRKLVSENGVPVSPEKAEEQL